MQTLYLQIYTIMRVHLCDMGIIYIFTLTVYIHNRICGYIIVMYQRYCFWRDSRSYYHRNIKSWVVNCWLRGEEIKWRRNKNELSHIHSKQKKKKLYQSKFWLLELNKVYSHDENLKPTTNHRFVYIFIVCGTCKRFIRWDGFWFSFQFLLLQYVSICHKKKKIQSICLFFYTYRTDIIKYIPKIDIL